MRVHFGIVCRPRAAVPKWWSVFTFCDLNSLIICFIVSSGQAFKLGFVTWPNETEVVVNKTVKFLWEYYVEGTDVDIKWGTSRHISPKVSTFDKIFFTAVKYQTNRNPVLSKQIPARYKGRVRIIEQASLQIVNVTEEDEGEYLCEISDTGNAWKTLSRAARLHVLSEYEL
jgi:hypothetical protein